MHLEDFSINTYKEKLIICIFNYYCWKRDSITLKNDKSLSKMAGEKREASLVTLMLYKHAHIFCIICIV